MKKNELNFKSEGLKLDYLSLNLQFNNFRRIKILANYLSDTFGCNSVYVDCKDSTRNCTLIKTKKNSWTVKFRVNSQDYWFGTVLNFPGNQATHLYKMIQERGLGLDWKAFDFENTSLSRIDVCYDRKFKESDKVELFDSFGKECEKQIEKAIFKRGVIRVGKRDNGNYFRAYRRENGKEIRFELELSKSIVKKFQFYLFSNQFEKLEELLCIHFYKQALTSFVRNSVYLDWLRENFRNIRASQQYDNCLITTYFKNLPLETIEKQEFLYQLLQLLSYIQTLKSSVNWISNENYRVISFQVNEFLEFLGKKKTNYYQIRKLVDFLKSLQSLPPVLEDFSKDSFQSILIFPYLKVTRKKSWNVELAISEKVYLYRYPFYFPEEFLTYENSYDLRAKIFFLLSFSTAELKKKFEIQEVLEKTGLSRQKMTRLRKSISINFKDAENLQFIDSHYTLLMKTNEIIEVEKLTPNLLVKAKSIFYTEIP